MTHITTLRDLRACIAADTAHSPATEQLAALDAAIAAVGPEGTAAERAEFERLCSALGADTTPNDACGYANAHVNAAWLGWRRPGVSDVQPVAYLIDWPDEPELGHYFAEAPTDAGRCRALVLRDAGPQPAAHQPSMEARYRFLLALLIERGVLTEKRYGNGTWSLQGIYGVDDSGLRGAGRTPEEAIDNAITMAGMVPHSPEWQEAWNRAHEAAQPQPSGSAGELPGGSLGELFTKKPVTIRAMQWTGVNGEDVQAFLHDGRAHAADGWVKGQYVEIGTLEGLMVAGVGDWIIRGVKGEFYPCKPDIFEATYRPAGTARAALAAQPSEQADLAGIAQEVIAASQMPPGERHDVTKARVASILRRAFGWQAKAVTTPGDNAPAESMGGGQAQQDAHWYAVDRDGAATLCINAEDARSTAAEAAQIYPRSAPYIATQLMPVGQYTTYSAIHAQGGGNEQE